MLLQLDASDVPTAKSDSIENETGSEDRRQKIRKKTEIRNLRKLNRTPKAVLKKRVARYRIQPVLEAVKCPLHSRSFAPKLSQKLRTS